MKYMELIKLYQLKQTVFTRSSLAQIYPDLTARQMTNAIYYAVKNKQLKRIRRGIIVKSGYNRQELACKVYPPAYVSLDMVLFEMGLIFQLSSKITCVSTLSKEIVVDGQRILYRKFKDSILTNPSGLINDGIKTVASLERAVLDTLFIDGERYLDNLRPIDWDKIHLLLPLYHNQALNNRINKMEKYAKNNK